jgi:hypothetical protein
VRKQYWFQLGLLVEEVPGVKVKSLTFRRLMTRNRIQFHILYAGFQVLQEVLRRLYWEIYRRRRRKRKRRGRRWKFLRVQKQARRTRFLIIR